MASSVPSIQDRTLNFDFDILNAQFNHNGRYFLKLSVKNPMFGVDGISVRLNDAEPGQEKDEAEEQTDIVEQTDIDALSTFQNHKFTFLLPRGFCKNDEQHDVFLLLEAFSLPADSSAAGHKVGEAKFAIYPRTNAPRINLKAKHHEDLYNYSGIMTLLRTLSTESISMHCGRIKYHVSFHDNRDKAPQPPRQPTPPVRQPQPRTPTPPPQPRRVRTPTPSPPPPREPTPPPREPTPPRREEPPSRLDFQVESPVPTDGPARRTTDSALGDWQKPGMYDSGFAHVAVPGKTELYVILHGARNLPALEDGRQPLPFVAVKTRSDELANRPAQGTTRTPMQATHLPWWEEGVNVVMPESGAQDDALMLTVADSPTKQVLVQYELPVHHLKPFHQYHLELVKHSKASKDGARLYATVIRKHSVLPRHPTFMYCGLEVFLRAMERPVENPVGPLVAVARIVPDYHNYKEDVLMASPRSANVTLMTVTFPSPHPSSFIVPQHQKGGYPQVSLAARPDEQPVWNHSYLFHHSRDNATIFSPTSALVIEYYPASSVVSESSWHMRSPIGFSSILLDQDVYHALTSEPGRLGVRVDGLLIQGTNLRTQPGSLPTVGAILRLITTERPDGLIAAASPELLPSLDSLVDGGFRRPISPQFVPPSPADDMFDGLDDVETGPSWRRKNKPRKPLKDGEWPGMDAVQDVLPEYISETTQPPPRRPPKDGLRQSYQPDDPYSHSLLEHQSKELDNYRAALKRMGADILKLREDIARLEAENSQLRRNLHMNRDAADALVGPAGLQALSRGDLVDKYALLQQKVSQQASSIKGQKERIQQLQNELIKKNDREAELLKQQKAQKPQQPVAPKVPENDGKKKKMEDTIKRQEEVIEKMEKLLNKQLEKGTLPADRSLEAHSALAAENARLRDELNRAKEPPQPHYPPGVKMDDEERLDLMAKLEKAEGRIISLENQLTENARMWGREKQELLIRMNERENGFARSSQMVLHDFPMSMGATVNGRLGSPKLDPIK
ncbi:PREDICTED: coiled-coil domain-containing protein 33-like [Branchiostoma belcheri]|uniref:Coiled-coil domain-containing protein 33-like n=1 Tax=Branchiostoma belcheri TaxID=7741 RepID=A0A6P4YIC4_BRABE|nr:PREDICTED: coiled-coil domain-containing protein 33-like [Branchiostoma belcheri]